MDFRECHPGKRVRAPADSEDVGEVERVDPDEQVVWVRFPVVGKPGRTDLIDIDALDLEPA